jgi:hypothetical protein
MTTLSRTRALALALSAAGLLIGATHARLAEACHDGNLPTGDTDVALRSAFKCNQSFINNINVAWDLTSGSWDGVGRSAPCDITQPFGKLMNSALLLQVGLDQILLREFATPHVAGLTGNFTDFAHAYHGGVDYAPLVTQGPNEWHVGMKYIQDEGCGPPPALACFDNNSGLPLTGKNSIHVPCGMFDVDGNEDLADRTSAIVHESWHAWEDKYDYYHHSCNGHLCGPQGFCASNFECDPWRDHAADAFEFGLLFVNSGQHHAPNQLQVEYLCDIGMLGNVPLAIASAAVGDAQSRIDTFFVNPPPVICDPGDPFRGTSDTVVVNTSLVAGPPTVAPSGCKAHVGCGDHVTFDACGEVGIETDDILILQRKASDGTFKTIATDNDPTAFFPKKFSDTPTGSSATYRFCNQNAKGTRCEAPQTVTLPHQPCAPCVAHTAACSGTDVCCSPQDACIGGTCQIIP